MDPMSFDSTRFVVERRSSQAIVIGDDIEIVLLEVIADHVRLGIKAPDGVSVIRSELLAE